MYRILFALVAILAIGTGLVVGTLNSDRVTFDLLWFQLDWPLGLLALCMLSLGILFGLLMAYFFQVLPLRLRLKRSQKQESREIAPPDVIDDD